MAKIPSHCRNCGAVFPSRIISIEGNVKGLTLVNNSEPCPFCSGRAYLAEGVFDIAGDVVSVLNAPGITVDMLKILGSAVIETYKDQSNSAKLVKVAESIDPKLAKVVNDITANKIILPIGLFLLALAIKSCNVNISLDANKLIDQLNDNPPQKTSIDDIMR